MRIRTAIKFLKVSSGHGDTATKQENTFPEKEGRPYASIMGLASPSLRICEQFNRKPKSRSSGFRLGRNRSRSCRRTALHREIGAALREALEELGAFARAAHEDVLVLQHRLEDAPRRF